MSEHLNNIIHTALFSFLPELCDCVGSNANWYEKLLHANVITSDQYSALLAPFVPPSLMNKLSLLLDLLLVSRKLVDFIEFLDSSYPGPSLVSDLLILVAEHILLHIQS